MQSGLEMPALAEAGMEAGAAGYGGRVRVGQ